MTPVVITDVSGVSQSRSRGTYATRFGVGIAVLAVLVTAAAVNLYTNLAPSLSPAQRADLLSGVATVLVVFAVGVVFLAASVGREGLSALHVLAERARRLEDGEFDVELETNRDDEFGEVYRALAEMRSGVERRAERERRAEARNEQVERYAAEWAARMDAVASGDLSQRFEEDVDDPELASLARSFNQMMDGLEAERQQAD
jgi:methyl-accepting chemotaxis protein